MAYNSLDLLFIKHSFDVKAPEFQRSLTNSLLISGIAMEIAGTSRPASGSEHLISHALDQVCRRPQMHGLQVGVATYLCALLQNNPTVESVREVLLNTGFLPTSVKIRSIRTNSLLLCVSLLPLKKTIIQSFPNRTVLTGLFN